MRTYGFHYLVILVYLTFMLGFADSTRLPLPLGYRVLQGGTSQLLNLYIITRLQ